MITSDRLQRAVDYLDEHFGLETLWIFGSEAQERARPDSDIDLAALFRGRPVPLDVLGAQGDLEEILGREVDLLDLDRSSPILAMQALKYGRLLVDRNAQRRFAFVSRTLNLYDDLKILRRPAERALIERFTSGRP